MLMIVVVVSATNIRLVMVVSRRGPPLKPKNYKTQPTAYPKH